MVELCEKTVTDSGLYIGNKLTCEHLNLTSYSHMNVHLAAQVCIYVCVLWSLWYSIIYEQVLSTLVAIGFKTLRDLKQSTQDTTETEIFCRTFDKFFDICNTHSVDEHIIKRKPNLSPFYKEGDERLKVKYFNCGLG